MGLEDYMMKEKHSQIFFLQITLKNSREIAKPTLGN